MIPPLTRLGNPARFLAFSGQITPWLISIGVGLLCVGLYICFFIAPADYQQGQTVRIMYIHVPSAWLAMLVYMLMACAALGTLVWRHPMANVAAQAAAPLGAAFTFLTLLTGALWGKPMWGTWWVWDARITSVVVLFVLYIGLISLRQALHPAPQTARYCAILTLVGALNIPIIRYSVDWWHTLHQPASVFRLDGPTIHHSMLWPLMLMGVATFVLFIALHFLAMENIIKRHQIERIESSLAATEFV